MELAGAGTLLTSIAEHILWVVIIGGILLFLFVGWLFKWENDREKRQRNKPHNARYDGGKRKSK